MKRNTSSSSRNCKTYVTKKGYGILFFLIFSTLFLISCFDTSFQNETENFRLFATKNMWNFIELDTITGKMWQIQFDVQGDKRGGVVLNEQDLLDGKRKIPGRFTLYETQNMYNFILHDQIDGRTWQAQWSLESENRGIIRIY